MLAIASNRDKRGGLSLPRSPRTRPQASALPIHPPAFDVTTDDVTTAKSNMPSQPHDASLTGPQLPDFCRQQPTPMLQPSISFDISKPDASQQRLD